MKIRAEVHSDDRLLEETFDALPYFEEATDDALFGLVTCGFGGDYPADEVAYFFATPPDQGGRHYNPRIGHLLDYCVDRGRIGFECHVDPEDAVMWLARNRPQVLLRSPDPDQVLRAIPHLSAVHLEGLLEHDDREVRTAAILALPDARRRERREEGPTPRSAPLRSAGGP